MFVWLIISLAQDCVSAGAGLRIVGSGPGSSVGGEMPGSFVPTVTAITTSQDLQWMVQPTLISSQASGQSVSTATSTMTQPVSLVDPYDLPGTSYSSGPGMTPMSSDTGPAPGPVRQSRSRSRRARDESVSEDGDVGVLVSVCAWNPCLVALCVVHGLEIRGVKIIFYYIIIDIVPCHLQRVCES